MNPCFVSSLDNLRLHANLSRVRPRTQSAGRQQDHRGMRRNGGLGRSGRRNPGSGLHSRGPQDGTKIERAFSRKKAQNAQKGNSPSKSPVCAKILGPMDERFLNAKARRRKGAESSFLPCVFASWRLCVEESSLSVQSAIRNPQCRRTQDTLKELPYLMIPTPKSGFIAPGLGLFAENRRNRLSMNILHKTAAFPMKLNQGQSRLIKVNKGSF